MTRFHAWRWCAAAGVVAFLCSWGFGQIPGLTACGPTGGLGPIIAFEFVGSPADVATLFGSEPCRSTFVAGQKIGLLLDALGFIPAYTTFLILATMASARITDRWPPAAMAIAGMLALAGLCDQIEGGLLYLILADLPGDPMVVDALWWPVHLKFALLAAGTLGIAGQLAARRTMPALLAGLAIGLGALTAAVGLAGGPSPMMMLGFTVSWTTVLSVAILGARWPSLFSGSANRPPAPASPSA